VSKTQTKKRLRGYIKTRTILLLMLTLIANTYAWFIYVTKVSNSMTAHVREWQFVIQDGEMTQNIEFVIDELYPGMEKQTQTITTQNLGEVDAVLSLEPTYLRVLNEEYIVGENDLTSDELMEIMKTKYPFKIMPYIDMEQTASKKLAPQENSTIEIIVNWEYESGDDELDTKWGNEAYKYNQENPDSKDVELNITIKASQIANDKNEEEST